MTPSFGLCRRKTEINCRAGFKERDVADNRTYNRACVPLQDGPGGFLVAGTVGAEAQKHGRQRWHGAFAEIA
jgi:hypothetical protein